MSENLLDIKQVAEYLRMNRMTVYKMAREGKIPAFKVASEWRFRKDIIDSWLMSQLKGKPGIEHIPVMPSGPSAGNTVLVVDDEEVIRDFFSRTLKDYRVLTAESGEQALSLIRQSRPDVVLLDIKMPGIDGIETLRRIKSHDPSIMVVMLSAFGTLEANLEAARLGAYTSMAKPFDLKEMKSVINSAMASVGQEKTSNEKPRRRKQP